MSLVNEIDRDLRSAMKGKQAGRVAVLRLLKNSLKNERIKLGRDLGEAEEVKVLQREAKQRRDSIEAYSQAQRAELAEAEREELAVITQYLPDQISEAELGALVDSVIAETAASGRAEMGRVIGQVMTLVGGRAEGAVVSRIVKQRFEG
ncbi:GatB/YqeY domain-containing protein [Candidatus Parcubacteria bacterium]|nr:GatB/YqeY domain-containing protein [Candidatus Parcubacteria bacterium]